MPFLKHILSLLLLQLVLFTAHGRVNKIDCPRLNLYYTQAHSKHTQDHDVAKITAAKDILSAARHSSDRTIGSCSKRLLPGPAMITPSQWLHHCTQASVSSIFIQLLQYYTFYQLLTLFPRHWFW